MKKTKHVSVPLDDLLAAIAARLDKREGHGSLGDCYVTIEIPDEEPQPFRVRTAMELYAEWGRTKNAGNLGDWCPRERTRDLAKLMREKGRDVLFTEQARWMANWLAEDLDAIADKDGE